MVMALPLTTLLEALTLIAITQHLVIVGAEGVVVDHLPILIPTSYSTIFHYTRFASNTVTLLLSAITSLITHTPMENSLPCLLMLLLLSILVISLDIPIKVPHTI